MKKLFFFRSSSGNGTDKAADSKMKIQATSQAEQEFDSPKSQGKVSGGPSLFSIAPSLLSIAPSVLNPCFKEFFLMLDLTRLIHEGKKKIEDSGGR